MNSLNQYNIVIMALLSAIRHPPKLELWVIQKQAGLFPQDVHDMLQGLLNVAYIRITPEACPK